MANKRTWWTTLASGAAVGIVCAALLSFPPGHDLEQQVGLRWLFALRGPVAPPEEVVVILISRRAAANISLPEEPGRFQRCEDVVVGSAPPTHVSVPAVPARWPRCLHAQLVTRLVQAGADVIAFDVLFRERPPLSATSDGDLQVWQDQELAKAFESAARVVVAQKLEAVEGRETVLDLSPTIADAALGAAPFPLVADSGRRINRFLTFKDLGYATPTLPVLALHAHWRDAYARLSVQLARQTGEIGQLLPQGTASVRPGGQLQATSLLIRRLFRDDPDLHRRVLEGLDFTEQTPADAVSGHQVRSLLALYDGADSRLLNFYGPPGTVPAVTYDQALAAAPETMATLFAGRIVFVGFAETDQLEQVEHFATVMSSADGPDLSGVEILATAFANLLRDESIVEFPLFYSLAIVFFVGLLSTLVCTRLGNKTALAVMAVALAGYGAIALYAFGEKQTWLPILLPMLVAAPAAMLTSFAGKYWTARRQREQLRRAFAYFVPRHVVELLERNLSAIGTHGESLECACVATDAANYTPLAETMSPEKLAEFLNHYFEALFGGVANRGGFVSDVVGDAMIAIWPNRSPDTRVEMLHGLLEMRDAAERFNERLAGNRLVTRFGVDWGRVALTTVGARMHYEYRAVGDSVNTASRIQELNKRLGTRVLVSQPALGEAGDEFLVRDLGRFLLRGKSNAVHVFELLGRRANATRDQLDLCASFTPAITALTDGRHDLALDRFREIQVAFPTDGPTAFYLRALQSRPTLQQGAFRID